MSGEWRCVQGLTLCTASQQAPDNQHKQYAEEYDVKRGVYVCYVHDIHVYMACILQHGGPNQVLVVGNWCRLRC